MRRGADRRPLRARAAVGLLAALAAGLFAAGQASSRPAVYFPPACQTVTFHSEPALDPQRVCMNLGVRTRVAGPPAYLFLTPGYDGAGIFRGNGSLVWWAPRPAGAALDADLTLVHLGGRPYLAVWAGRERYVGRGQAGGRVYIDSGSVLLYNQHYERVGTISAGAPFASARIDMHEFRITPDGHALVGIDVPVRTKIHGHREILLQYVVQELSLDRGSGGIHTGGVVFQWNSIRHVPPSASHVPNPGAGRVWDYFHGNSIAQDTDGNLLVSARNTWGIYKINVRTGAIMWQVGAPGGHTLSHPWCYQHDVSALGHDEYSVFDDGSTGNRCFLARTGHPARGLIVRVDPSAHPATVALVHVYSHHPSIYSEFTGGIQQVPGGETLVDWGYVPEVTEYRPGGRIDLDLSLSSRSYRGFSFPWKGEPSAPPKVSAQLTHGGAEVWASWNGSTEVRVWRVLGGPTASVLSRVTAPIHSTGFETSILLRRSYPVVAVQALSLGGQVLGTSRPIHPR